MNTTLMTAFLTALPLAAFGPPARAVAPQSTLDGIPLDRYQPNLLGNGGFELWGQGSDGSIPPEQWLVMGNPANTFNGQQFLTIERVAGDPESERQFGGGQYSVELMALQPGNYLSQKLENASEFRCKTLTLSASFYTPYNVTSPTISIDDGVASSSDERELVVGHWRRLTVTHTVSAGATQLEIRLDPDSICWVDEVQLSFGKLPDAVYVPRPNPEPALMQLPVGAIVDWCRLDPRIPVPEGYAICDGSVIQDGQSAYLGLATPNLSDRFVLGVTDVSRIGETGGVASHNLTHNHPMPHIHTGYVEVDGWWWWILPANNTGLQSPRQGIDLNFATGQPSNSNTSNALGTIDNRPPYFGLLKIMRIK